MLYGKYKNVRNSAWQALLDFNVTKLPVSVNGIAKQLGIKVIKNSDIHELQNEERGATILKMNIGISYLMIPNLFQYAVSQSLMKSGIFYLVIY